MADVKILITGYSSSENPSKGSCSTIVLVRDQNLVMIIDPGTVKDQKLIINALKKEKLELTDINLVGITHSHLDHYRNIGMFPKSKTIDYWGLWDKDQFQNYKSQFSKNIKIIKTPGHSYDSISFIIKTTEGIVVVCGDVFWQKNHPTIDPFASDSRKLMDSRKKIIQLADYIIPGHGKMFGCK